jgi:hypothetical protein
LCYSILKEEAMAVIYKYPLSLGNKTVVPDGQVLHFGKDANDTLCAWVSHSAEKLMKNEDMIKLYIVGTGHTFDEYDIPLMSFVDGDFVWHLIMDWKID